MQVYDKNFAYTLLRIFWVNPIIKLSLRRLTVRGKENLPKDGAIIIGSNHTIFPPELQNGGMLIVTAWWGIWHIIAGLTAAGIFRLRDRFVWAKRQKKV